jgi:hypothetical protein
MNTIRAMYYGPGLSDEEWRRRHSGTARQEERDFSKWAPLTLTVCVLAIAAAVAYGMYELWVSIAHLVSGAAR